MYSCDESMWKSEFAGRLDKDCGDAGDEVNGPKMNDLIKISVPLVIQCPCVLRII